MKTLRTYRAFTLIELLVVISIIAILAGIALPVFSSVQVKGAQTKALSNAKQIGLACKLYATDNNGLFPSKTLSSGKPTTTDVADSNSAFAQLFPDYLQSEQIFYQAKSAFTPAPPDDKIDNPSVDSPVDTLKAGENHWAYVVNLSDTSNAALPLIADGFSDPSGHTYTTDETARGGVWKGKNAIVIRADISGSVMKAKVNGTTSTVSGNPNGGDLFDNSGITNWLGSANKVVNPK